ncbi:MAG: VOC family protein, partial [Angustibacter sp.]
FAIGPQPSVRRPAIGLYHLAWEVTTLAELGRMAQRLEEHSALTGAADHGATKAIYGTDPDGIALELCWLVPAEDLTAGISMGTERLDLDREMARYGANTLGGRGISWGVPEPTR